MTATLAPPAPSRLESPHHPLTFWLIAAQFAIFGVTFAMLVAPQGTVDAGLGGGWGVRLPHHAQFAGRGGAIHGNLAPEWCRQRAHAAHGTTIQRLKMPIHGSLWCYQKRHTAVNKTDFHPLLGPIGLDVVVRATAEKDPWDATNYLGGIADVLQEKTNVRISLEHLGDLSTVALYRNDRQIREIHYRQEYGEVPAYRVRIWPLPNV